MVMAGTIILNTDPSAAGENQNDAAKEEEK
jgi:hypothetical protein